MVKKTKSTKKVTKSNMDKFSWSAKNKKWAENLLLNYPSDRKASCVIPFLWQAQKQNGGHLDVSVMEFIADQLDMPYIRVYEVVSFYTMFNLESVGKYFIQLCTTTPCMLCGSGDLVNVCEKEIGPKNKVTKDGLLSWTEVECLGACANAPMAQINDYYYEDLTKENFSALLKELKKDKLPKFGSQKKERHYSAPITGQTTLLSKDLFKGKKTKIRFKKDA